MARIIIIGGGVAGLSAGIYAQMGGHQAVICEQHSCAGGNLTGWRREGYLIDNCIHWLTGTNPATDTYKMWCELGALGNARVHQGDSLYTYAKYGKKVTLYKDLEQVRRELLDISPDDGGEIEDLISAVRLFQGMSGIAGEGHNESISKIRLATSFPRLLKYYRLSTGELAKRFKHPLLQGFICSMLGDDFASLALIMVFAHFCGHNGGIPEGSTVGMAERMTERFLSLGGELRCRSEAVRINRFGGVARSVSLADGSELEADYVVLCTDPAVSFKTLLGMSLPHELQRQYDNKRMMRFSSYHCAFACDVDRLPFNADYIFEIHHMESTFLRTRYLILREFSHEPSFAPEGKSILQTITFCDERDALDFIALSKNKGEYQEKKRVIAETVKTLIEKEFPELCGKLKPIDVWTPATYKRYTASEIGSYMSFVLPSRRFPRRIGCEIEGLDNVFLATQWQQSPGGLPIAAACGKMAAEKICERERRRAHKPFYLTRTAQG